MKAFFKNRSAVMALCVVIVFVVSLIPILMVSFYNHPGYDDFYFSIDVYHAIQNGGNLFDILGAAASRVVTAYNSWQGTFSAIFLFALQPAVFSEDLYFLSTFILLGSLIGSTIYFFETIMIRWLKQRTSHMLIVSLLVLFTQIQFIYDAAEGLFWFNGAMFYTFFHCVSLVLWALLIRLILAETVSRQRTLTVVAAVVAFIVGGGNYSTGLFVACGLALMLFFLILLKKPVWRNVLAVTAVFLLAFIVNMAAPGNAVRASYFVDAKLSPVRAIIASFIEGMYYTGAWSTWVHLLPLLMAAPLICKAASQCNWSFRYPFVAIVVAYGFFACLLTPPLYAMGFEGSPRQINIYYYTFILMLCFDIFYLYGWIAKHHPALLNLDEVMAVIRRYALLVLMVFAVLFLSTNIIYGQLMMGKITAVDCFQAWQQGLVQEYDRVVTERHEQMVNTTGECVLVGSAPDIPFFISTGLQEGDGNGAYASFYGCEKVIYLPSETE